MNRDELLAAVIAERYGTPEWFTRNSRTKPTPPATDDSPNTTAHRQALLDADTHPRTA